MSDETSPSENQNYEPRLRFLKVICILTFAGSGLGALSYGSIGIFFNLFKTTDPNMLGEEQKELIKLLFTGGRLFFLINAILYIVSLRGAQLMWRLKKTGFHYYTFSQILILISPLAFIKGFQMPAITVILAALFIAAYAGFLKIMR